MTETKLQKLFELPHEQAPPVVVMYRVLLRALTVALLGVLVSFIATPVHAAGTTGGLRGVVTAGGVPLENALVTVDSPSQRASAMTDANGSYEFLALSPDTYRVTVEKQGYAPRVRTGVTITADAMAVASFTTEKRLQTIGNPSIRR